MAGADLSYEDTTRLILRKLVGMEHPLVLIGGQAIGFWAQYYLDRSAELAAYAPYTSKDVDFCAAPEAVRECARQLGGHARVAGLDDATPNTGTVTFVDSDGYERTIDFIGHPAGLRYRETIETSIEVEIIDAEGASFRVLHPVLSLESRAANVATLPGRDSPHALNQLRAAVVCAREFLLDLLAEGEIGGVLALNERVFGLAAYRAGLQVYVQHGIDVFEAAVADEPLPKLFRTTRYPQMKAFVERRRARAAAPPRGRDGA